MLNHQNVPETIQYAYQNNNDSQRMNDASLSCDKISIKQINGIEKNCLLVSFIVSSV